MHSEKNHIFSPAKLNLGLRIVGRRQDGFHRLESLFWPITFGDEIEIERSSSEKNSVLLEWADIFPRTDRVEIPESENVVWKTLNHFSEEKYSVLIRKRIPTGGGLGGGSSNAGSVLRFLHNSAGMRLPEGSEISKLGADIPFFLKPVPSWVTGIGENMIPVKVSDEILENLHFVLLFLPRGNSTPRIFSEYRSLNRAFSVPLVAPDILNWGTLTAYFSEARNDLAEAAGLVYPLIPTAISFLKSLPGVIYADLTGSGSTCYGVFPSKNEAEKNIKEIGKFCREYLSKGITVKTYI